MNTSENHNAYRCRQALFPHFARLAGDIGGGLGVHEKRNNESVKTQDFGENENQDHANEQSRLLGSSTDTSVTDDTDSKTCVITSATDSTSQLREFLPAAKPAKPTDRPAPNWMKPV
jgi:hypothetical protein